MFRTQNMIVQKKLKNMKARNKVNKYYCITFSCMFCMKLLVSVEIMINLNVCGRKTTDLQTIITITN